MCIIAKRCEMLQWMRYIIKKKFMFLYCNNVYVKRDYYNAKIYILVVRFAIVSLLTSYRIAPPRPLKCIWKTEEREEKSRSRDHRRTAREDCEGGREGGREIGLTLGRAADQNGEFLYLSTCIANFYIVEICGGKVRLAFEPCLKGTCRESCNSANILDTRVKV